MMRWASVISALLVLLVGTAHAFVSEDLDLTIKDGVPDLKVSYDAPFAPLDGDGVGGVTLMRESLTGDQRLRAESCRALMEVYYDGAWEVESQDTAYHTVWLIARCVTLDHLVRADAPIDDQVPLLDLSPDRLPAHLAPYSDCQDRVAHIKAGLAGGRLATHLDDRWQRRDDGSVPYRRVYETATGQTLTLEVLAAYQGVRPVWLVLVSNSEPVANSTIMDVWSLTLDDSGTAVFADGLDLVQAVMTGCPTFLPLLLATDCM